MFAWGFTSQTRNVYSYCHWPLTVNLDLYLASEQWWFLIELHLPWKSTSIHRVICVEPLYSYLLSSVWLWSNLDIPHIYSRYFIFWVALLMFLIIPWTCYYNSPSAYRNMFSRFFTFNYYNWRSKQPWHIYVMKKLIISIHVLNSF